MKYRIERTDKASDQLYEIIHYIASDSGRTEAALTYLEKIERAILQLADYPFIGSIPRYSILKRKGYRVLIVERHLIFYRVNDEQANVTIHAVVDGRREYRNMI